VKRLRKACQAGRIAAATAALYLLSLSCAVTVMQSENPFLDQVAKFVTNAAGAAKGVRDEIATLVRAQGERFANDLELVPREEFEAMKAVALKARSEIESLKSRITKLESERSSAPKIESSNVRNRPVRSQSPTSRRRR
jgi:BMFP domain-containing protein YqiC